MRTTATLNALVESWLADCDVLPLTKTDYRKKIHLWFRWLSSNNKDPRDPVRSDVVAYKDMLLSSRSNYTANSYVTVVKLFYAWCASRNYHEDIGHGIRSSSVIKYYNKIPLDPSQARLLLRSIGTESMIDRRDRLIVALMLFNGLRCCEVSRIDVADITRREDVPVVYICRKGRTDKREYVVLHPEALNMFEDYISDRRSLEMSDPLFISHRSCDKYHKNRLSSHHIAKIVKARLRAIGIDNPRISAHSLRHTFGCMMVEQGVDLEVIRDMMGHGNADVTKIYTEMARERQMLHNSPILRLGDKILGK